MKRTILIILISLILIILTGCQNPLSPVLDQMSETTDYYPIKVGNKWIYYIHNSSSEGKLSITVTGTEVIEGKNAFILIKKSGTTERQLALVKEKDGIYGYRGFDSGSRINVIANGWYKILPYPLLEGNSWNLVNTHQFAAPSYLDFVETETWTVLKRDDLTVRAGTFENCYYIEYQYHAHYTHEDPFIPDLDLEYYENTWYAPNVGIIKNKRWGSFIPDPENWELESYRR